MFVNTQVNFALYAEEFGSTVTIWVFASLWNISYSFGQISPSQANIIRYMFCTARFFLDICALQSRGVRGSLYKTSG